MEYTEFISINELTADLRTIVDDEEDKYGLGEGYYMFQIQKAVEFFAIETLFDEQVKDFLDFDPLGKSLFQLPSGVFNLDNIYLFNKEKKKDYVKVHWKRNMSYQQSGGRMMDIKDGIHDDVMNTAGFGTHGRHLVYANTQRGLIIFSENSKHYDSLRLKYHGLGSLNGEIPCIPRVFREGLIGKAKLDALALLKLKDRIKYSQSHADAYGEFHGNARDRGAFKRLKSVILSMSDFERQSLREYIGNIDFV